MTPRTKLQRRPDRGSYDRALAYEILDEALVCSVGFLARGEPHVMPMAFARLDDRLILHGASKSRLVTTLCEGPRICVTVTLLDGIVLARSAMHHSLNYRAVVVFGSPVELVDPDEKRAALVRLVEHVLPGRSAQTRAPNELEMRATRVLALPIEEASVKCRRGGPIDDAEDLALPHWAGQIPLSLQANKPIADAAHSPLGPPPAVALDYARGRSDSRL
ncbi:MAG TPA: pyridoxamine 5'-phosphate oxidase family protein [Polyangiaceae bacterium]